MATKVTEQDKYHAHLAFGKAHPEAAGAAIIALSPWERGEMTMVHAVGVALQAAYAAGQAGEPLPKTDLASHFAAPPSIAAARKPVPVDGTISPELARMSTKYKPPTRVERTSSAPVRVPRTPAPSTPPRTILKPPRITRVR